MVGILNGVSLCRFTHSYEQAMYYAGRYPNPEPGHPTYLDYELWCIKRIGGVEALTEVRVEIDRVEVRVASGPRK